MLARHDPVLLIPLVSWAVACSEATSQPSPAGGGGEAGHGAASRGAEAGHGAAEVAGTGGDEGRGGAGDAGAEPGCEGDALDCDDCPTLEDFRESCADAFLTTCGGTMVGPLGPEPFPYTYCYAGDGTLIGKISDDTDYPSNRIVEGTECRPAGPSEALCEDGPRSVVTPTSEAVRIHWFSYFSGSYRFERRLDQLSERQRELATAIRVTPPTGACWDDATELSIAVSDGDIEQEFSANDYSGTCGRDVTLVDFEAVSALLGTVDCLPAKDYDGEALESAPTLTADDGCFHGLFNGTGTDREWWFRTEIPGAGDYRFVIDRCGDRKLDLDLFEDDGTTTVASVSGTDQCPALIHTFASAGSYVFRVRKAGGSYAGDFYLAIESSSNQ